MAMSASDGATPERAPGGDIVTTSLFNVTLLEESLWVGSLGHAGRQEGRTGFGRLALRRLLSAAEHACVCPRLRPASASQPAALAALPNEYYLDCY